MVDLKYLIGKSNEYLQQGKAENELEKLFSSEEYSFMKRYLLRRDNVDRIAKKLFLYRMEHDKTLPVTRENRETYLLACFQSECESLMKGNTKDVFKSFYAITGNFMDNAGRIIADEETLSLAKEIVRMDVSMGITHKKMNEIQISIKSESFENQQVTLNVYHSDTILSGINKGKILSKLEIHTKDRDLSLQDNAFYFTLHNTDATGRDVYNTLEPVKFSCAGFLEYESVFLNLLLNEVMKKTSEQMRFVEKLKESLLKEGCCYVEVSVLKKYIVVPEKKFETLALAKEFIEKVKLSSLELTKEATEEIRKENLTMNDVDISFSIRDDNNVGIYNLDKSSALEYLNDYYSRPSGFLTRNDEFRYDISNIDTRKDKDIFASATRNETSTRFTEKEVAESQKSLQDVMAR